MNEPLRFLVCADDDDCGNVTVYVKFLPEDANDHGEADRWACYEYPDGWQEDRAAARTQAKARARTWCWDIAKRHPCEWATNWEEPR